jgi:hypothetical protein
MSHKRHATTFQDATTGRNIASGKLAAVYVEYGSYQWTDADVDRMAGVFGIATGGNPSQDAHLARCCDTEPQAFTPGMVPEFIKARMALGHRDAMCYCDQSEWEEIEKDCIAAGVYPWWWIACPGKSVAEAQALRSLVKGIQPVAAQNLWTQGYDESVILRPSTPAMQFVPPHKFHSTG